MVSQLCSQTPRCAIRSLPRPAVGALDGLLQLVVGEIEQGLEGTPGFAFFFEK
jgi:hypothetical protein